MSFTERFQSWTDIIKNIVIIVGISLAVIFVGLSVYANISEGKDGDMPDPPSIEKAQYKFIIGQYEVIYTDKYEVQGNGKYLLNGYYALGDDKYKLFKINLPLDEKYCGKIKIIDRTKPGS